MYNTEVFVSYLLSRSTERLHFISLVGSKVSTGTGFAGCLYFFASSRSFYPSTSWRDASSVVTYLYHDAEMIHRTAVRRCDNAITFHRATGYEEHSSTACTRYQPRHIEIEKNERNKHKERLHVKNTHTPLYNTMYRVLIVCMCRSLVTTELVSLG